MSDTIGIDLGTTSIKVGRFDGHAEMMACTSRAYHAPDEHEVSFDRIWSALREASRELVSQSAGGAPVVGVGLSSQTNSFALVGADARPVSPVYLWVSDFAGEEAAELNARFGSSAIGDAVGMTALSGQLVAPKCLHLQRRGADRWSRMSRVWLLSDLVTYRLCGQAVTDPSLWSLTGLYDLNGRDWWAPMREWLGLKQAQLPALSWAGRCAGRLSPEAADDLGLPGGIAVAVGALDHLAGAIGVGNVAPGVASLSTGTASCVVVTHAGRPRAMEGGVVGRHPADAARWYALTWSGLSSAGLNWYARQAGGEPRLSELLEVAGEVPDGADGWRAVPHDPRNGDAGFDFTPAASGGADRPTDAQAMRAILDRITAEIAALVARAADGRPVDRLIASGGGARSDVWLQLLADRLGVDVIRPACLEASARGASRFAALAAGQVGSLIGTGCPVEHTFKASK